MKKYRGWIMAGIFAAFLVLGFGVIALAVFFLGFWGTLPAAIAYLGASYFPLKAALDYYYPEDKL